jgi:hypothetical protein
MALKVVRLELARTKEHPDGDPRHGYEIRMPLTRDGRIDAKTYKDEAQLCTVRHFRPDAEDERGQIGRTSRGSWAISYLPGEDDDEPVIRLGDHVFRVGQYVTIVERDGGEQVFKVVSVRDAKVHA